MDFNAWLSSGADNISPSARAIAAWRHIQRDPQAIAVTRNGVVQAAQTVRLVFVDRTSKPTDVAPDPTGGALATVTLFGVANHPDAAVPDTNIQRGDVFQVGGNRYRVDVVMTYPGEVQAICEVWQ